MIGYEVTVSKALPEAVGMMTYAILENRLTKAIVRKEIKELISYGDTIKTNIFIGQDISISQ